MTTKERILEAAGGLMMDKGIKNTSLADISKVAGISKGTLFYHYTAKNDLIYDLADRTFDAFMENVIEWARHFKRSETDEATMAGALEYLITTENRGHLFLYMISESMNDDFLRAKIRSKYLTWRSTVKTYMEEVFPRESADYTFMAQMVIAVVDGLVIQWMLGIEDTSYQETAKMLVALINK